MALEKVYKKAIGNKQKVFAAKSRYSTEQTPIPPVFSHWGLYVIGVSTCVRLRQSLPTITLVAVVLRRTRPP
jgi:hypothetical protein